MGAGHYSTEKRIAEGYKHRQNVQSLTLNQTSVGQCSRQRAVRAPTLHIGQDAVLEDGNSQPLCEII